MSLTALLEAPRLGRSDKVLAAYQMLDATQAAAFRTIIHDPLYSARQIAEALGALGHDVNAQQVTYFRSKLKAGQVQLDGDTNTD